MQRIKITVELELDLDEHKEHFDEALGEYASKEERQQLATAFAIDALEDILAEAISCDEFADYVTVSFPDETT